jgi:predicted transport protein
MAFYRIEKESLIPIDERSIDLERDIQRLTEINLDEVFGLQLIKSEFILRNFRFDTLAFDNDSRAFVIIEYKRDRNSSVIDQGFSYLGSMLENKAEFVLEYNSKLNASLKKEDIDWSQSRVIFISQAFTTYQQSAVNFKDLPIELWEVKKFSNDTIFYNQLLSSKAKDSIKAITKNKEIRKIAEEVKVYTVEDHFEKKSDSIKALFDSLKEKITSLGDDIREVPKKMYIAYKAKTNFVDVIVYAKELRLTLNIKSGYLYDPQDRTKDFTKPKQGHWGNGDYEFRVRSAEDLPYALMLIEQSYVKNK